MSLVWELDIDPREKFTLLALADHADDEGVCYPSKKRVAWKCGVSERTVQRHVQSLKESGLLEVLESAHHHQAPRYRIVPSRGDTLSPLRGADAGSGETDCPPSGETNTTSGETPVTFRGDTGVSLTIMNHQMEPSEKENRQKKADRSDRSDEPIEAGPSGADHRPPPAQPDLLPAPNGRGPHTEPEDPTTWMHEIWHEELGIDGHPIRLTDTRRTKYRAMYREQLADLDQPRVAWRLVLRRVKASEHHMSERAYQMPESLLRNPERRETWVQRTIDAARSGTADPERRKGRHQKAHLAAEMERIRQQHRTGGP